MLSQHDFIIWNDSWYADIWFGVTEAPAPARRHTSPSLSLRERSFPTPTASTRPGTASAQSSPSFQMSPNGDRCDRQIKTWKFDAFRCVFDAVERPSKGRMEQVSETKDLPTPSASQAFPSRGVKWGWVGSHQRGQQKAIIIQFDDFGTKHWQAEFQIPFFIGSWNGPKNSVHVSKISKFNPNFHLTIWPNIRFRKTKMSFQSGPKNPRPGPKWLQVPSFRPAAVAAVAISGGEKCWNLGKLEGNISMKYCWVTFPEKTEQDSYSMDGIEKPTIMINWYFGWTDVGSKNFCTSKSQPFTGRLCQGYADRMLVETLCLASRAEINGFLKTHSMQQKR